MKTAEKFISDYDTDFWVNPINEEGNTNLTYDGLLKMLDRYASQYKSIIAKQEELIKTLSDDSNKDLDDYEYYLWDKYVRELESELAKLKEGETK
jgi:hypothetical protein